MSSQGPSTGTGQNQVPHSYTFSKESIRDGSDWTAYKKQLLMLNENKSKIISDPSIPYGNDYRIQVLLGKYKQPTAGSCTDCDSNPFSTGSVR